MSGCNKLKVILTNRTSFKKELFCKNNPKIIQNFV